MGGPICDPNCGGGLDSILKVGFFAFLFFIGAVILLVIVIAHDKKNRYQAEKLEDEEAIRSASKIQVWSLSPEVSSKSTPAESEINDTSKEKNSQDDKAVVN